MVLFILAVLWAGLIFSWLRERTEVRSVNSISSFSKHLSVLERTTPASNGSIAAPGRQAHTVTMQPVPNAFGPVNRRPVVHMSLSEARRRRLNILVGLGAAATVTFLLALVMGGKLWLVNLAVDACLGAYIVLLARAQRIQSERQAKVRYLPGAATARTRNRESQPSLLMHRSAN